jgi:hypothetical protein
LRSTFLSSCCAFLGVVLLLFTMLLSSLPCCSSFHANALFTMLFSSSRSYFFFTFLLFSSWCLAFLFALLLSFLVVLLFQVQGFSRYCFPFHVIFFFSLCCCCWCVVIHWRILYYPHAFLLVRIGNG